MAQRQLFNERARKLDINALGSWLWEAACKLHGATDAPKCEDYILPLIFLKRLSDVFDNEVARLAKDFGDERPRSRWSSRTTSSCASSCPSRRAGARSPSIGPRDWASISLTRPAPLRARIPSSPASSTSPI